MQRCAKLGTRAVGVLLAATLGTVTISGIAVVSVATASTTMTATTSVNLRSGPGTSYPVLTVVPQGGSVQATGASSGAWLAVTYNGTSGYMNGTYLASAGGSAPTTSTPSAPADAGQVRSTTALNLRTEGYLGDPVRGVLPADSLVDLTGETTATYVQIQSQGELLWISNKYVVPLGSGPTAPAASGVTAKVVEYALAHVGYPYAVGTKGPDTYDCSGLVTAAYASAGVTIPYSTVKQSQLGTPVAYADLRPGDVIVWGSPVSAVSIYIGNDQLVIADGYGYGIRQMSVSYRMTWATFGGGRRYVS